MLFDEEPIKPEAAANPAGVTTDDVLDAVDGMREDIREGIDMMKAVLGGLTQPQINVPAQKPPNIYVEPSKVAAPAVNVSVPEIRIPEAKWPEMKRPKGMGMDIVRDSAGRMSRVDVEFKY